MALGDQLMQPPVQRAKRLRDAMSPGPVSRALRNAPWNPEMGFSSLKKADVGPSAHPWSLSVPIWKMGASV